MVKGVRIARAVLLLLRTLRTAIFLSAGKDSSTRSNSVFSSAASAPPAAAPPAPGAIIIMPPPPPADASTSKVSSIALTSSDASSRVMDFSLSMTSSTTALIATLECETLDELGMAGAMKPEKGADGVGAQHVSATAPGAEKVCPCGWQRGSQRTTAFVVLAGGPLAPRRRCVLQLHGARLLAHQPPSKPPRPDTQAGNRLPPITPSELLQTSDSAAATALGTTSVGGQPMRVRAVRLIHGAGGVLSLPAAAVQREPMTATRNMIKRKAEGHVCQGSARSGELRRSSF